MIREAHGAGTTIVMTSHNRAQAERLGEDVIFIDGGRIIESQRRQFLPRAPPCARKTISGASVDIEDAWQPAANRLGSDHGFVAENNDAHWRQPRHWPRHGQTLFRCGLACDHLFARPPPGTVPMACRTATTSPLTLNHRPKSNAARPSSWTGWTARRCMRWSTMPAFRRRAMTARGWTPSRPRLMSGTPSFR